jgi:site-specific DNA-methyltransferase (adenine-specific)
MEIINIDINKLKPYKNNPRKNDEAVEYVANSIKEFGFKVPIIVDKDYEIIAGHTRLKAAQQLGLKEVPIIIADDLTEEQVKAFRLADNKVGEIATWDLDLLDLELGNIVDLDMNKFGFDLFKDEKEVEEDNYDVDKALVELEPKAKLGDIYQLGNHRLMCGDSTSEEDVEKLMSGETIKCVFTSPPYNMNANMYANYKDNLESNEYIDFNLKVIKNIKKHLKGFLFWNISYNKNSRNEFLIIANKICELLNFKEMIIWNKKKATPIRSNEILTRTYEDIFLYETDEENRCEIINLYESERGLLYNKERNKIIKNYWEISVDNNTQLNNHKACFPVKLPAQAIELTTNENDIVMDCFGGSGSTLIACEQLNRKCYMMELDPKYVDVIINRWETFTGNKAVLLNGGETK